MVERGGGFRSGERRWDEQRDQDNRVSQILHTNSATMSEVLSAVLTMQTKLDLFVKHTKNDNAQDDKKVVKVEDELYNNSIAIKDNFKNILRVQKEMYGVVSKLGKMESKLQHQVQNATGTTAEALEAIDELSVTVSNVQQQIKAMQLSLTKNETTEHEHKCPTGFSAMNVAFQSCYKIVTRKYDWFTASEVCRMHKAGLVSIETEEEQAYVSAIIKQANNTKGSIWTGGNDLETEGAWIWAATGEPFQHNQWITDQPNNQDNKQHCLELSSNGRYLWNDDLCSRQNNFICEYKLIWWRTSLVSELSTTNVK